MSNFSSLRDVPKPEPNRARLFSAFRLLVAALWLLPGCGKAERELGDEGAVDSPCRGGTLTVGVRGEPHTWNRILAADQVTHTVTEQLHAGLVRLNRLTQEVEPALAESWAFSEDGRELTFNLRAGVRFSDGTPFTAADVAFTFRALHDERVSSPLVETATLEGVRLTAEVVDPLRVRFRLPRRTAVVERVFDSLAILPAHRLGKALESGSFASEYGLAAEPSSSVGLGPFVLQRYVSGQRVILKRNPYYWKTGPGGASLPRLEGITFEILPDANALLLRFRAGDLDLLEKIPADDFLSLRSLGRKDLMVSDLGAGLAVERLWFNLNPRAARLPPEKRAWFSNESFRRAVSLAIDREAIVEGVYRGLASIATGPVPRANARWSNADLPPARFDPQASLALLAAAGFRKSGEKLLDGAGRAVRFSLLTNAGNPSRLRTAAIIQEDLARLGIEVDIVTRDFSEVVARFTRSFEYQAALFAMNWTDPDPSAQLPLWQSRSPLHVWQPSQSRPATTWEARIDFLMERQMLALEPDERKRLFDEVQALVVEHLPLVDLVTPHVLIGTRGRLGNLKATSHWHALWNSEELFLPCEALAKP
jgi:peptide/nickel transport system substrate-binding protein